MKTMDAYYFGCGKRSGHFWFKSGWLKVYKGPIDSDKSPLGGGVDGGVLCPVGDCYDGKVMMGFLGGFTFMAWWDRSVDSRAGSHSLVAAQGRHSLEGLIAISTVNFPGLMERQKVQLVCPDAWRLFS